MSNYEQPQTPIVPEANLETPVQAEQGGYYPSENEIVLSMRAAYRKAGEPVPEYYN